MENNDEFKKLISIPEAAVMLHVSARTIARLIADGQLHAPKIRRRRLVSIASVDELISAEPDQTLGTNRQGKGS